MMVLRVTHDLADVIDRCDGHIDGKQPFASAVGFPGQGHTVFLVSPIADIVPDPGVLHLDHIGAEIGQYGRNSRARQ